MSAGERIVGCQFPIRNLDKAASFQRRLVSKTGIQVRIVMVNLRFMGGTQEVGRNAILVDTNGSNLLLDYGVKIGKKPNFPGHIRAKDVDGITRVGSPSFISERRSPSSPHP